MINNTAVFVLCQMVGDSTTIKGLFTSEEQAKSAILDGNWLIVPVKVNQLVDVVLSDKAPGALLIEKTKEESLKELDDKYKALEARVAAIEKAKSDLGGT
ncbi:MAG: hypothetical protein JRJ31_16870 [Deltaproteobacteria bacterium]|nr:hypothetical protein [Deltaproteobacteria bacterium]